LVRHERYAGDLASLHENTIRSLSSGLVTVTPNGLITSINEAACEILAVQQAQALGMPLAAYIPGLTNLLTELGSVGTVRRQEVDAVRPDGNRASPGRFGHAAVGSPRPHDRPRDPLPRSDRAAPHGARRGPRVNVWPASGGWPPASRTRSATHSPASRAPSEILKSLPGADADTRQLVDITVREVDRLNRLITDLLHYARPINEDRQLVDLSEMAHEMAKTLAFEKRDVQFQVDVDAPERVEIFAAAGQIRQVFWNLGRNAADAMPTGGTLHIRVNTEELMNGRHEAVITVKDNGVGIPAEDLERIFEPFYTRGKAHGSGLGLATVNRIVDDHKGTIEVTSEAGQGTTFALRFSLAETLALAGAGGIMVKAR